MFARLISEMNTLPARSMANSGSENPEFGRPENGSRVPTGVRDTKSQLSPPFSDTYW
jgi:hypothetical protein